MEVDVASFACGFDRQFGRDPGIEIQRAAAATVVVGPEERGLAVLDHPVHGDFERAHPDVR